MSRASHQHENSLRLIELSVVLSIVFRGAVFRRQFRSRTMAAFLRLRDLSHGSGSGTLMQWARFVKHSSGATLKTSIYDLIWLRLLKTTLGVLSICAAGCTPAMDTSGPVEYQIPWLAENGSYRLQDVRVETFNRPFELKGEIAEILVDPYLVDGQLQSGPVGRFVKNERGVMIPSDFASLQAATIYAHTERFHKMDVELGLADRLRWPEVVSIQTNVKVHGDSVVNNALFDGRFNSLLIVPYLKSKLPISFNAGILAHEHFHKIYQALVMSPIQQMERDEGIRLGGGVGSDDLLGHAHQFGCNWAAIAGHLVFRGNLEPSGFKRGQENPEFESKLRQAYNKFVLRGLNEGLADFWGWVYTGDVDFIGHSMDESDSKFRRLDKEAGRLPSAMVWKNNLVDSKGRILDPMAQFGLSYRLGTYYARFLRDLTSRVSPSGEFDPAARWVVAQALINALPMITGQVRSMSEKDEISPNILMKPLLLNLPVINDGVCGAMESFAAPDSKDLGSTRCRELKAKTDVEADADAGSESQVGGQK